MAFSAADYQAMGQGNIDSTGAFVPGVQNSATYGQQAGSAYYKTPSGGYINQDQYNQMAQAQKDADLKAQGLNPDGSPMRPDWQSLIDPKTGKLLSQYDLNISQLDPSQWQGYQQYKSEALRAPGSQSPWAAIQLQKQQADELAAKSGAAQQATANNNQAYSGLAMHGGVSNGAQQMLALQNQRNLMGARQGVANTGMMNRLGIQTTDEANREAQLQNLMGSEQNIGQFNKTLEANQGQYNINNLLQENQGQRAFQMGTYDEQMKKWAADRQAQATERSGGGGGK